MKLINKIFLTYFIYSVILLLIAIPVFYAMVQDIVVEDMDEEMVNSRELIKSKVSTIPQANQAISFHFLTDHVTIVSSANENLADSFYTIDVYDSIARELVPHRVLLSQFAVKDQFYRLQVRTSLVDRDELIERIVLLQVLLLLCLFAGLLLINYKMSKKIWKPFYHTLELLKTHRVENSEPFVAGPSAIIEFNDLNASLSKITSRGQQSYQSQKEFTENASHEMQTPLAIFQTKLELLMQTTPMSGEQAQIIADLADNTQRLERLNKALLSLSSIENNQYNDTSLISLLDVTVQCTGRYMDHAKLMGVEFETKFLGDVMLRASGMLVDILVGNLVLNAITHNHSGGTIKIVLNKAIFVIENTGAGPPIEKDKVLKRFQKGNPAGTGTGLGLAIVKQVCILYGYQIQYVHDSGRHRFSIRFENAVDHKA